MSQPYGPHQPQQGYPPPHPGYPPPAPPSRNGVYLALIAAVVVLAGVGAAAVFLWPSGPDERFDVNQARGVAESFGKAVESDPARAVSLLRDPNNPAKDAVTAIHADRPHYVMVMEEVGTASSMTFTLAIDVGEPRHPGYWKVSVGVDGGRHCVRSLTD